MTRVRKTLARGGLQACDVLGSSRSSTRPWRTHVRLSNRVTSVSFCESWGGEKAVGWGTGPQEEARRSPWVQGIPVTLGLLALEGNAPGYVCVWGGHISGLGATCPAMNCPKPGGKVRVEMSRVTSAGKSSRLETEV